MPNSTSIEHTGLHASTMVIRNNKPIQAGVLILENGCILHEIQYICIDCCASKCLLVFFTYSYVGVLYQVLCFPRILQYDIPLVPVMPQEETRLISQIVPGITRTLVTGAFAPGSFFEFCLFIVC